MMVLSRLLHPRDFGLVAMATAITGLLALFRDFGLSTASVQRATVTEDQLSTLFWINLVVGAVLAAASVAVGPFLVAFYGEPLLSEITLALAVGFLLNGAAVQHRALLQRQMQFESLAIIDITSLVMAVALSVTMAFAGFGYWAIVVNLVFPQVAAAAGVWTSTKWIPGRPRLRTGLRPLLKFGGTLTLNSLVMHLAYNTDKILLGRYWGAEALGIYSRAYQLVNLPIDGLNSSISQVALPALAKVQGDLERIRRHFLHGYGVFLAIMAPVTVASAVFAGDIVLLLLGAQWETAAPVFARLTPTMLVLAIINPLSWLLLSTGRTTRSLCIALMIAPVVVLGYILGLAGGPEGVATGFSIAMLLVCGAVVIWASHGTGVSAGDVVREAWPSLISAGAAGLVAFGASRFTGALEPVLLRLTVNSAILFLVFGLLMFFTLKERSVYRRMLSDVNPFAGPTREPD